MFVLVSEKVERLEFRNFQGFQKNSGLALRQLYWHFYKKRMNPFLFGVVKHQIKMDSWIREKMDSCCC